MSWQPVWADTATHKSQRGALGSPPLIQKLLDQSTVEIARSGGHEARQLFLPPPFCSHLHCLRRKVRGSVPYWFLDSWLRKSIIFPDQLSLLLPCSKLSPNEYSKGTRVLFCGTGCLDSSLLSHWLNFPWATSLIVLCFSFCSHKTGYWGLRKHR